jgi:fructokinase
VVVVCGEALIDVIRYSDGTQRQSPGGGPFNAARGLARLGVPTAFLGRLSQDAYGRQLADLLVGDGVSLDLAVAGPEPTTIAMADIAADGRAEYHFELQGTSAPNLTLDMLPDELGPDVDAIYLGALGLAIEPMASTLIELARREHSRRSVILDPNIRTGLLPEAEYGRRLREVASLSSIVKASDADLAWLYPGIECRRAAELVLGLGVGLAVVTLGPDGAFAAHGALRAEVASPRVQVADTVGAGDSFGAGLLAWLYGRGKIKRDLQLTEAELRSAMDFACRAAAMTCTRTGADPPWVWEMAV